MPSPLLPIAKLALEQVLLLRQEAVTQLDFQQGSIDNTIQKYQATVNNLAKQLDEAQKILVDITADSAIRRTGLEERIAGFDKELAHFNTLVNMLSK